MLDKLGNRDRQPLPRTMVAYNWNHEKKDTFLDGSTQLHLAIKETKDKRVSSRSQLLLWLVFGRDAGVELKVFWSKP